MQTFFCRSLEYSEYQMTRVSRSFSDAGFPTEIQQVLGSFLIFWSEYPYYLCLSNISYELWILSETFPSDRQFQINGILLRWYVYGVFTLSYVSVPVLYTTHHLPAYTCVCCNLHQIKHSPRTQFDSTSILSHPKTLLINRIITTVVKLISD